MTTPLHITTDGAPVYTPCRKVHGENKVQVEEQLRQWEAEKVIERCDSNRKCAFGLSGRGRGGSRLPGTHSTQFIGHEVMRLSTYDCAREAY